MLSKFFFVVLIFCLCLQGQNANPAQSGLGNQIFDNQIDDVTTFRKFCISTNQARLNTIIYYVEGESSTPFPKNSTPGTELCMLWKDIVHISRVIGGIRLPESLPSSVGSAVAQIEDYISKLERIIGIYSSSKPIPTTPFIQELTAQYVAIIQKTATLSSMSKLNLANPVVDNLRILSNRLSQADQTKLQDAVQAQCKVPGASFIAYLVFKQKPIPSLNATLNLAKIELAELKGSVLALVFLQVLATTPADKTGKMENELDSLHYQILDSADSAAVFAQTYIVLKNVDEKKRLDWCYRVLPVLCYDRNNTTALLQSAQWQEPWLTLRPIFEDGVLFLIYEWKSQGTKILTRLEKWFPSQDFQKTGVVFHPAFLAVLQTSFSQKQYTANEVWQAVAVFSYALVQQKGYDLRQLKYAEKPASLVYWPQSMLLENMLWYAGDFNVVQKLSLHLATFVRLDIMDEQGSPKSIEMIAYARQAEMNRMYQLVLALFCKIPTNHEPAFAGYLNFLEEVLPIWCHYTSYLPATQQKELAEQAVKKYKSFLATENILKIRPFLLTLAYLGTLDSQSNVPILWDGVHQELKNYPQFKQEIAVCLASIVGYCGQSKGLHDSLATFGATTEKALFNSELTTSDIQRHISIMWYQIALGSRQKGSLGKTSVALERIDKHFVPEKWILENEVAFARNQQVSSLNIIEWKPAFHQKFAMECMAHSVQLKAEYQTLSYQHILQISTSFDTSLEQNYARLQKNAEQIIRNSLVHFHAPQELCVQAEHIFYQNNQNNRTTDIPNEQGNLQEITAWLQSCCLQWPSLENRLCLQATLQAVTLWSKLKTGLLLAKNHQSLAGIDPHEFVPAKEFHVYRDSLDREILFIQQLEQKLALEMQQESANFVPLYQQCMAQTYNLEDVKKALQDANLEFSKLEIEAKIYDYETQIASFRYEIAIQLQEISKADIKIAENNLAIKQIQSRKADIEQRIAAGNVEIQNILAQINQLEGHILDKDVNINQIQQQLATKEKEFADQAVNLSAQNKSLVAQRWQFAVQEKKFIVESLQQEIVAKKQAISACLKLSDHVVGNVQKQIEKVEKDIKTEEERRRQAARRSFWKRIVSVATRLVGTAAGCLLGNPMMGTQIGGMIGDAVNAGLIDKDWNKALLGLAGGAVQNFALPQVQESLRSSIGGIENPILKETLQKLEVPKMLDTLPNAIKAGEMDTWIKGSLTEICCSKIPQIAQDKMRQFVAQETATLRAGITDQAMALKDSVESNLGSFVDQLKTMTPNEIKSFQADCPELATLVSLGKEEAVKLLLAQMASKAVSLQSPIETDKAKMSVLVTAELQNFSNQISSRMGEIQKEVESSPSQDAIVQLNTVKNKLQAYQTWAKDQGKVQADTIKADLIKKEQDLKQANLQTEITQLDKIIAGNTAEKDFLQAKTTFEQAMAKIGQTQLLGEIIKIKQQINARENDKIQLQIEQSQRTLEIANATVEESKKHIQSAEIELNKTQLMRQVQKHEVTIAEINQKIATLREQAHDQRRQQQRLTIKHLESRFQTAEAQQHILPLVQNQFLDSYYSLSEIQDMQKEAWLRAFYYVQAMRSILIRTSQQDLPQDTLLRALDNSFKALSLQDLNNALWEIYIRQVHVVLCQDIDIPPNSILYFLQNKYLSWPVVPQDFPQGRADASLIAVDVYFQGKDLSNQSIAIDITLKGPFIRKLQNNAQEGVLTVRQHAFFETLVTRKYDGYTCNTIPSIKQASEVRQGNFAEGFWYINPFCTWEIVLQGQLPDGVTPETIEKMKIRLYYRTIQPNLQGN